MNYLSSTQLVAISDLQRNYASLIERVKKISPLLLLRRNRPEAVLISVATYEDLVEKNRLYEEKLALEAISEFEKDKKGGKLFVGKRSSDLFKFANKLA